MEFQAGSFGIWRPRWRGPVCALINSSFREGYVPPLWKAADVCPVPKVPQPRRVDKDLRPISLTPVLSKLAEKHARGWLMEHMEDMLDPHQFGSLSGCSTVHAMIELYHNWLQALEKPNTIIRILYFLISGRLLTGLITASS